MAESLEREKVCDEKEHFVLADYDAFGFDLDHTLAKYNLIPLFELIYSSLTDYLVEVKGYDKDLLKPFRNFKKFCTRGLVLDCEAGKLLKLDQDGRILRASHGTTLLSNEEIEALYGKERRWSHADELLGNVNNFREFRIFENFFDMPGAVVSARVIDIIDKRLGGRQEKYTFWPDVIGAFNYTYTPQHFPDMKGGYFPDKFRNLPKYVSECTKEVKQWLKLLRENKRVVYVMTSSRADLGVFILKHILGEDWRDYFDISLFYARKPGFFTEKRPFLSVDDVHESSPVEKLECGKLYSQGNVNVLMDYIKQKVGKENPKVVYFGDSVRSDVFPSKVHANWETVLILEELEAEGMQKHPRKIRHHHEDTTNKNGADDDDDEPICKKMKNHIKEPPRQEKDYLTSDHWGSFFFDDINMTEAERKGDCYMNTFWGLLIRKYADICVPQLDYLTDFPLDHKFEVFNHEKKQTSGFYPSPPVSLAKVEDS
ncbi:5'-nucleotidase domain-containing protein 1-like [Lineus longissimus]|uniref:5'-nucleotidase domain-containing protein 1-like n=1 Tax=Lineus longissimus TaxID=88925 RepID=UPI002B4D39D0